MTPGGVARIGRARMIRLDALREALQARSLGSLKTMLESLGVATISCDGHEWILPAAFEKAIARISGVTLEELDSYEKAHGVLTTEAIRERLGLRVYRPHARPKRRKRLASGPDIPKPDVPGQEIIPFEETEVGKYLKASSESKTGSGPMTDVPDSVTGGSNSSRGSFPPAPFGPPGTACSEDPQEPLEDRD